MAGQTLAASTGTWSGVSLSYAYQWKRCDLSGGACTALAGATESTYALGTGDVGTTLRVDVTASNRNGAAKATSAPSAVVAPTPAPPPSPPPAPRTSPPSNTSLPQINGTFTVGQTLTATTGSWNGSPSSYAYQWKRCDTVGNNCASIAGAGAASYLLVSVDAGTTLRVAVTAANTGGSATATSAATGAVAAATLSAPTNTSLPQLSGTAQAGQTMTASSGSWSGSPTSYAYQWRRCDSGGASCSAIAGATASTYKAGSSDVGASLRAAVTATNSGGATTAVSGASQAVSSAPAPPAGGRFGVATGGGTQNLSATDLARYLDGVKAARATWVRTDINWGVIQSGGPSSYNWGPFDNVVNAARARGLNVLASIIYTPAWARGSGTSGTTPPTNLSDLANFAKAAATHYGAMGVHAYEVWNEPNIAAFWAPAPDPVRYAQLLKLAYPAIKQGDPAAVVVSAGLSPYGSYGQSSASRVNPITFLEKMYANGAGGSFDAVGWHPYNYPYAIGFYTWSAWSQMGETSPSARSVMMANGDGAKQIWATEFGAPTGSTSNSMSEAGQAQLVTDAYAKLKTWTWAGPAFFYSYRNVGTNLSNIADNFGIIRYDWSLKPAYGAFQTAAAAG
jgi:polysaccharide biosynthesis protein PslG